jgi:hypothetical protein
MERWAGLAAITAGIAFGFALPLVATAAGDDPVGVGYDDYNRLLTLPLALLLLALAGLRALQLPELSPWGRRGAVLALLGSALLVAGNAIEFWAVLLSDDAVFALAADRGLNEWAGSTIGWLTFLVGGLLLFAGGFVFGSATAGARILPPWTGAVIAMTAPFLLAAVIAWTSSVPITAGLAIALAAGWVALGGLLLAAVDLRAPAA